MINKNIIITITSFLLTIVTVSGIIATVKFWPKSTPIQKQKPISNQSSSYAKLKNLSDSFDSLLFNELPQSSLSETEIVQIKNRYLPLNQQLKKSLLIFNFFDDKQIDLLLSKFTPLVYECNATINQVPISSSNDDQLTDYINIIDKKLKKLNLNLKYLLLIPNLFLNLISFLCRFCKKQLIRSFISAVLVVISIVLFFLPLSLITWFLITSLSIVTIFNFCIDVVGLIYLNNNNLHNKNTFKLNDNQFLLGETPEGQQFINNKVDINIDDFNGETPQPSSLSKKFQLNNIENSFSEQIIMKKNDVQNEILSGSSNDNFNNQEEEKP